MPEINATSEIQTHKCFLVKSLSHSKIYSPHNYISVETSVLEVVGQSKPKLTPVHMIAASLCVEAVTSTSKSLTRKYSTPWHRWIHRMVVRTFKL